MGGGDFRAERAWHFFKSWEVGGKELPHNPESGGGGQWAYEFDFLGSCNILGMLVHTVF